MLTDKLLSLWASSNGLYQQHKSWLKPTLIVVAVFLLGLGTGKYLTPSKIVYQDKIQVVEKQVVVEKVKTEVQVQKVYVENKNEKVHRTITETKKPDGTTETVTNEDVNTDTTTKDTTNTNKTETDDKTVEKDTDKKEDKSKLVVNAKPSWRIGADVGVNIPYYLGKSEVGVPNMKGTVVGLRVDRRILGPVFMDIWGNTQGSLGVGVSAEF